MSFYLALQHSDDSTPTLAVGASALLALSQLLTDERDIAKASRFSVFRVLPDNQLDAPQEAGVLRDLHFSMRACLVDIDDSHPNLREDYHSDPRLHGALHGALMVAVRKVADLRPHPGLGDDFWQAIELAAHSYVRTFYGGQA